MTIRSTFAAICGLGVMAVLPVLGRAPAQEEAEAIEVGVPDAEGRGPRGSGDADRTIRVLRAEVGRLRRALDEERAAARRAEGLADGRRPTRGRVRVGGPDALVSVEIPGASRAVRASAPGPGHQDEPRDRDRSEGGHRDRPRSRAGEVRVAEARVMAERARVEAAEVGVEAADDRRGQIARRSEGLRRGVEAEPIERMRERIEALERMRDEGLANEDELVAARTGLERVISGREARRIGVEAQARIDEREADVSLAEAKARLAEARARLVEAEVRLERARDAADGFEAGHHDADAVLDQVSETTDRVLGIIRSIRRAHEDH